MAYFVMGTGNSPVPIPQTILSLPVLPEKLRENMRSAIGRNLPEIRRLNPHGHTLSIAGGGPSIADTYKELTGYVGAVNKSHDWLLEKGVVPNACCILDPLPVMAEAVTPHKDVTYLIASCCDPALFDKLRGYRVGLWHASNFADEMSVLKGRDSLLLGGGTTVSLRWLNIGYVCGFRSFHIHGVDSSAKDGRHHAYDHAQDDDLYKKDVEGRRTHAGALVQIAAFFGVLDRWSKDDVDPVSFKVFGEGLFQYAVAKRYPSLCFMSRA